MNPLGSWPEEKVYSEHELREQFEAQNLPLEKLDFVRNNLNRCAAIWKWQNGEPSDHSASSEVKAQLGRVGRLAHGLAQAIEDLPHQAKLALESQFSSLIQSQIGSENENPSALCIPLVDGGGEFVSLQADDIVSISSEIGNLTFEACDNYRAAQRTKRDYPLDIWIANIRRIWTDLSGRPYSRDATSDGQPVSPAAEFTVFAYSKLSPDTPPTKVLNAMKRNIAEVNRKVTGK